MAGRHGMDIPIPKGELGKKDEVCRSSYPEDRFQDPPVDMQNPSLYQTLYVPSISLYLHTNGKVQFVN